MKSKMYPSGVELMRRLSEGTIEKAPLEYVKKTRALITDACEEIIEVGARIRPLIVEGKQIGWVRGVHHTERKMIQRWLHDSSDFIFNMLLLATTLKPEEITPMSAREIMNLSSLVKSMSDYDLSLYPYISAYTSTMSSESLWHGRGTQLVAYENRTVSLPDGKQMRLLTAPEHARLWATLATYREQAKKRLDENWNAVLVARTWGGKALDPVANDLRSMARQLQTDNMEPWENAIRVEQDTDINDGWAHPSDTVEGLTRELKGMLANDKHEQLIEKFESQQKAEAVDRKKKLDDLLAQKGGPGVYESESVIETEAEVLARERDMRRGRVPVANREVTETAKEKLTKYH